MHLYNHSENALHVKGNIFYHGRYTVQDYPVNTDQNPLLIMLFHKVILEQNVVVLKVKFGVDKEIKAPISL